MTSLKQSTRSIRIGGDNHVKNRGIDKNRGERKGHSKNCTGTLCSSCRKQITDVKQLISEAQVSLNGNTRPSQLQHECVGA